VAKLITLNQQLLYISFKLLFPIVGVKISFLFVLALKSPNKTFMWYLTELVK